MCVCGEGGVLGDHACPSRGCGGYMEALSLFRHTRAEIYMSFVYSVHSSIESVCLVFLPSVARG